MPNGRGVVRRDKAMTRIAARTTEQVKSADPGHSVWVMANAGSGKTQVLVDRVVRLLLAGFAPETILCLTFTKAAAAEMSLRLFNLLASWIGLDDDELSRTLTALDAPATKPSDLAQARRLFAVAIETPGGLKIQTIHAFCEKLLQLFPVESGLAPGFAVMDDTGRTALLQEALTSALNGAARVGDTAMLLLDDGAITSVDSFEELAKLLLPATAMFHHVLAAGLETHAIEVELRQATGISLFASTADIEAEIIAIDRSAYARAAKDFADVEPLKYGKSRFDVAAQLALIAASQNVGGLANDLSTLYFTQVGTPRGSLFIAVTRKLKPGTCTWLDEQQGALTGLLTAHALSRKVDATLALIRLMRRVNATFGALKAGRGLYDFDDLIMRTRSLLQESRAAQWVLYKLDGRLSHILIDEAQDTSPAQWDIIKALADEFFAGEGRPQKAPRTTFVVGDIKQSIFSFQGADTDAFEEAREHFRTRLAGSGQELKSIDLTLSFRSLPAVLEMVDVVFGEKAPAAAGLKQKAKGRGHTPHRTKQGQGMFAFWPLFRPGDEKKPDHWLAPVDRTPDDAPRRRLARYLAQTIQGWIGRRLLASRNRPVAAGDILILLQRRGELFNDLLAELRRVGVPVAGADRLRLQQSLVVLDLMALTQFCLLPEDDLALAAILKSPLVPQPVDEEQLTAIAHGRSGSLWASVQDAVDQRGNMARLQHWQKLAETAGPHGFLAQVLSLCRAPMLARLGAEALDASNALLDVALGFEREHGTSLAGFLHWFSAREEDVKRELQAEGGEVRLMTVHGAKGLEADIVILPDAADLPGRQNATRVLAVPASGNAPLFMPLFDVDVGIKPAAIQNWRDTMKEKASDERKRLFYVAMTRARDELYIGGSAGVQKLNPNCWYELARQALFQPDSPKPLRPVAGEHPEGDTYRWGDEPQWRGEAAVDLGDGKAPLPPWLSQPAPGGTRNERWSSPTRLAAGDGRIIDEATAARGLAIHAVLEKLLVNISDGALAALLQRHGLEAELGLRLRALLQREELTPYFAPEARAEVAIAGRLAGLPPLHGKLDRLLVRADAIWLLDFKTGPRPAETPLAYLEQMAQYAAILGEAYPGRDLNAALLWTQDGTLETLQSQVLSRVLEGLRQRHAPASS